MNNEDLILIDRFCLHHGIELTFFSELHEFGMVKIIEIEEIRYFPKEQLSSIEKIVRLYHELDINLEGIDVIITLLQRIDDLQTQLLSARNRINFFDKN